MNEIACQENALRKRFITRWNSSNEFYNAKSSIEVWQILVKHYTGSERHYHNINHLKHCIEQLDLVQHLVKDPIALEVAIFFHDIICQPGASDNELQSAILFEKLAKGKFGKDLTSRIMNLILATKHTNTLLDSLDERLICDIDLSSFALPWDDFLADSDAIRAEAGDVSAQKYISGKIEYLDNMLHRSAIYMTDFFNQRYEVLARENIKHYIKQLNKLEY